MYFCFVFFSKLFCFVCVCFCLFLCFRLVYLSFCIYNRKHTYKNIFKKKTKEKQDKLGEHIKNRNTLFPSRNLRDIYSRSGPGLDILYFCFVCFSRSFSVLFLFVYMFVQFSPSLFKLLLEYNTIHYTKHKQTWNGYVHDLCQLLKVMFKFISNYMTFAADLKGVFVALK